MHTKQGKFEAWESKQLQLPEVNPVWVCDWRAAGFAVLLRKLQQIRQTHKDFLYNSPSNIFIYAEGNCSPRSDAINKISSGIGLITSCRVPESRPTRVHLCSLIHKEKMPGCCICPLRVEWQKHDGPSTRKRRFLEIKRSLHYWCTMDDSA